MLLLPCPGAGSCCSRTDHSCERSACAVAEHAGVKFVTGKRDRLFSGTSLFVQLSAVLAEELHAPFVQPQQPSVGYGAATEIAGQVGQYATPLGIGFQDLHVPYLAAQLVEQASESECPIYPWEEASGQLRPDLPGIFAINPRDSRSPTEGRTPECEFRRTDPFPAIRSASAEP